MEGDASSSSAMYGTVAVPLDARESEAAAPAVARPATEVAELSLEVPAEAIADDVGTKTATAAATAVAAESTEIVNDTGAVETRDSDVAADAEEPAKVEPQASAKADIHTAMEAPIEAPIKDREDTIAEDTG